jgi:hypothetical protein
MIISNKENKELQALGKQAVSIYSLRFSWGSSRSDY